MIVERSGGRTVDRCHSGMNRPPNFSRATFDAEARPAICRVEFHRADESPRSDSHDRSGWLVSGEVEERASSVQARHEARPGYDRGESERRFGSEDVRKYPQTGRSRQMSTHRFLVVLEDAGANFSAYSPDLPGCVATGETREEAEANMYEAIQLHIEGLKEDGFPIPTSTSVAEYVVVGG